MKTRARHAGSCLLVVVMGAAFAATLVAVLILLTEQL